MSSLQRRALGGTFWTVLGFGAQNVLRLAGNIVLTRLLFPEAFGLMTIVNVFIQGLWLFTDIGTTPSIVQNERGDDPRFLNTAWTIQVGRGALLTFACLVLAWPVTAFYQGSDPLAAELLWYLPVAGLSALADGAASTRIAGYKRHLRLAGYHLLEVVSQVVALVVMIAWALVSPSVWALVAGVLAKSVFRSVVSHLCLEGSPNRPAWDPEAARSLFRFGKWIFVSTLLTFCATQADRLLLGKLVTLDLLGVYGIAASLAMMPMTALSKVGSTVVFPVLSRLRDQGDVFMSAATRVRLPLLLGGGALISGLIPAGPALIDTLYDERYTEAGWMLQLLLVGGWFRSLESPNNATLLAQGRTGWIAIATGTKTVTVGPLLVVGFSFGGFVGAIGGLVISDVLKYVVSLALVRKSGVPAGLSDLALTALLLASVAAGWGVAGALESAGSPAFPVALAAGITGSAPWVIGLFAWWRLRGSGAWLGETKAGERQADASPA